MMKDRRITKQDDGRMKDDKYKDDKDNRMLYDEALMMKDEGKIQKMSQNVGDNKKIVGVKTTPKAQERRQEMIECGRSPRYKEEGKVTMKGRPKDVRNQLDEDAMGKFWARNGFSKSKSKNKNENEVKNDRRMKYKNPSKTIKLKSLKQQSIIGLWKNSQEDFKEDGPT